MKRPDRRSDLVSEVRRLDKALTAFRSDLDEEPARVMSQVLPDDEIRARAIIGADADLTGIDVSDLERILRRHREQVIKEGLSGLEKVQAGRGAADLDRAELAGLEAIVNLAARPAILFRNGEFPDPVPPWGSLVDERDNIKASASAVGQIHFRNRRRIGRPGTGFLVGTDVVMTNRHVARDFAERGPGGKWGFRPGRTSSIDWSEDPDAAGTEDFVVEEVIGVHEDFDLALLRVAPEADGNTLPAPLSIAAEKPDTIEDHQVYVVGYPQEDIRNSREAQRLIFGGLYNLKRLQPGEILRLADEPGLFNHDCSTLGGNSGSCVIDLETHTVVGLHFRGEYLKHNQAVALWALADDPLLVDAGVLTS